MRLPPDAAVQQQPPGDKPPELSHRVLDDLVFVHRGAAPEAAYIEGFLASRNFVS